MSGQTAESPTTCSVSGFRCLGEPPCIYTLAWLPEQAAVLMRDLPRNTGTLLHKADQPLSFYHR